MRKLQRIVLIIMLYMSACASVTESIKVVNQDGIPLEEFVIGRWETKEHISDLNGDYIKNYTVDFVSNNKLNFSARSPYDGFNEEFEYRFINDNTIVVENARAKGGEWSVDKNKEKLNICIWSTENCLEFARSNSWNMWLYITSALVVMIFFGVRFFHGKKISD